MAHHSAQEPWISLVWLQASLSELEEELRLLKIDKGLGNGCGQSEDERIYRLMEKMCPKLLNYSHLMDAKGEPEQSPTSHTDCSYCITLAQEMEKRPEARIFRNFSELYRVSILWLQEEYCISNKELWLQEEFDCISDKELWLQEAYYLMLDAQKRIQQHRMLPKSRAYDFMYFIASRTPCILRVLKQQCTKLDELDTLIASRFPSLISKFEAKGKNPSSYVTEISTRLAPILGNPNAKGAERYKLDELVAISYGGFLGKIRLIFKPRLIRRRSAYVDPMAEPDLSPVSPPDEICFQRKS